MAIISRIGGGHFVEEVDPFVEVAARFRARSEAASARILASVGLGPDGKPWPRPDQETAREASLPAAPKRRPTAKRVSPSGKETGAAKGNPAAKPAAVRTKAHIEKAPGGKPVTGGLGKGGAPKTSRGRAAVAAKA